MQNVKIEIHNRNLDIRKQNIKNWKIPEQDKKDLIKFLGELALGKVNKGKKISEQRQLKYLDILKIPLEFFGKTIDKLTLKDVEGFEKALSSDKLKSKKKNKPFALETKADIRKILRTYLRWKLKDKAVPLVDWFDVRVPNKTPNYLSEAEIEKLYKNCKNNSERFLIAVLFDSGARAEEFHNIRYEDIQLPEGKDSFVKLTLKEEYSKTRGRVISLYWKHSLEAIRDYLTERKKDGIKLNEPVFENSYDNTRQVLLRLGLKVLSKSIHYHLFRHSSSTFYASKMNRQELCYRYGWAFSSRMPDVYISRAGMENKQLDEKFNSTELEEVKTQLSKEEFERKKMQEDFDNKEKEYAELFNSLKKEVESIKKKR